MSFCTHCGKENAVNARFCPHCGKETSAPISFNSGGTGLHCPNCKSTNLSATVESTNTGGTAVHVPVSKKVGMTTYSSKTIHRNYWMCHHCGNQFRNIQNLEQELAAEKKRATGCFISAAVLAVISLILGIVIAGDEVMAFLVTLPLILMIVMLVLFLCIGLSAASKTKKLTTERDYLRRNCFN